MCELEPYPYGWRCELPARYRFFGCPVRVKIETRPSPADELPPPPNPSEVELVRLIVSSLSELLAEAERQYATFDQEFPELFDKIDDPHVWVCREFLELDGPDRWALVSGISDAPDWCIHIEFRGLEFHEIWAGD